MKAKAVVHLRFPSKKDLETVYKALMPEVNKPTSPRSRITMRKENMFLVLDVEARDTTALRAALNSYLRWVNSLVDIVAILEKR